MYEDLDYYDRKLLPHIKRMLRKKLQKGDNYIDIQKFCAYFNIMELLARKLILNVEVNDFMDSKFVFINGHKDYESQDKIRMSKNDNLRFAELS
jgi:hypothetical protein